MRTLASTRRIGGIPRQEAGWAVAETAALLLIFVVAFGGRDEFGDGVKTLLIVLSVIAGGLGALAGLVVVRRGYASPTGRVARVALGSFMVFIGLYSVVHVLS
jgi:hypothetical protein